MGMPSCVEWLGRFGPARRWLFHPVRCGLSIWSRASLEHWITRWSLSSGGASADPAADDDSRGVTQLHDLAAW